MLRAISDLTDQQQRLAVAVARLRAKKRKA
jgi:hypothetical protein